MACPCGCGASETRFCWKTSEWEKCPKCEGTGQVYVNDPYSGGMYEFCQCEQGKEEERRQYREVFDVPPISEIP